MPETSVIWIDADGTPHTLSSDAEGVTILYGRSGLFMAPPLPIEDVVPLQDGGKLRSITYGPRIINLPLLLRAASQTTLRTLKRDIMGWFAPDRGDGILRVTAPGGDQREIVCRLVDGLGIEQTATSRGYLSQKLVLGLKSWDPHWRAVNATQISYQLAASTATFFPWFPIRLTNSTIFSEFSVDNTGDVKTWPSWVIVGPGDDPVLRNVTMGKLIDLTGYSLAVGETVVIDTSPGVKSVVDQDGVNIFSSLSNTSSLWPLERDSNALSIELSNAVAAVSEIQLTYRLRYFSV